MDDVPSRDPIRLRRAGAAARAGVFLAMVACGAASTAPKSAALPSSGTPACSVSPKDDACDVCEAQRCCPEQVACEANAACKAADDALDACEARVADAGHARLDDCYKTFGASGPLGAKRADCLRTSCGAECL